jgi:hypothetical protein
VISALCGLPLVVGWVIGSLGSGESGAISLLSPVGNLLSSIGLGSSYICVLSTSPDGAWVEVDDKPVAGVTPMKIQLPPGRHRVTLGLPNLGSETLTVSGRSGDRTWLAPALEGSIRLEGLARSARCRVTVDGIPSGVVPTRIDHLRPGLHELWFVSPGVASWNQIANVRIGTVARIVVQPMPPGPKLVVMSRKADPRKTPSGWDAARDDHAR